MRSPTTSSSAATLSRLRLLGLRLTPRTEKQPAPEVTRARRNDNAGQEWRGDQDRPDRGDHRGLLQERQRSLLCDPFTGRPGLVRLGPPPHENLEDRQDQQGQVQPLLLADHLDRERSVQER